MITLKKSMFVFSLVLLFLSGCNTSGEKQKATESETKDTLTTTMKETQTKEQVQHPGVFFRASGNEPFWNIALENGQITFTSLIEGYEELHTPLPEVIRAADANVKMYRVETEKVRMRLEISQGNCADTMADKSSPYSVKLEIQLTGADQPEKLKGCGAYETDPRLNDIWILEQLGTEQAELSWFSEKVPEMEINTTQNTLMGFAGCNRMRGSIFWEPGLLRFTDVATTRMACKPGNREADFLKNLRGVTTYRIEDNRLWLSNPNGLQLVFRKVD